MPNTRSNVLNPDILGQELPAYFHALHRAWGPQHWWPGRTRFEVIVGAYLTQNTTWNNVELALARLRAAKCLSLRAIREVSTPKLENLIRPAGYFRQKAQSLKNFVSFVDERYEGSLARMFAQPTNKLRAELLALKGVGPETADSILLYAGQHPVFVVDAYARRIFTRHELIPPRASYEEVRSLVQSALAAITASSLSPECKQILDTPTTAHRPSPMSRAKRSAQAQVYNEMHGLLVAVGKNFCLKAAARCEQCPLRCFLPRAKEEQSP